MSSFASAGASPPSNTLYGARAIFSINGVVSGYATSVSWANSYSYQPLNVLGSIETTQHLPMLYQTTLTANNFRLVGTTLRTMNFWPKIGTNAQDHLRNLTSIAELSCTVEDLVTNVIVASFSGCRVESSSISVSSGNLMAEDITFVCRRCADESET